MMRKNISRLSALALALLLICSSTVLCFAFSEVTPQYAIVDDANLFSEQDVATLKARLAEANAETGWQIIIHTDATNIDIDGSRRKYYTKNFYKTGNFEEDAAVLVFNPTIDGGTFFGTGAAQYYFNDSRDDKLKPIMRSALDSKTYLDGACRFADKMVEFHDQGSPELEKKNNKLGYALKHYWWVFTLIAIVAGAATYGITAGKYKYNGRFNTYDLKSNSNTTLTDEYDNFVTKHVSTRTIQTSSGSSSSGGSSSGGGSRGADF